MLSSDPPSRTSSHLPATGPARETCATCHSLYDSATGEPFAIGKKDVHEGDDPVCHLECNATRCPFDKHAPIVCPFVPPGME